MLNLRACLRNPLPLLLRRRGLGRGGPFLTRALHALAIFRRALRRSLPVAPAFQLRKMAGARSRKRAQTRDRAPASWYGQDAPLNLSGSGPEVVSH